MSVGVIGDVIDDVIDLDRYPLGDLESTAGRRLLAECHAALDARGACELPGFLRRDAVDALVAEASRSAGPAHRSDDVHNVYFESVPEGMPASDPRDPRGMLQHSSKLTIAWDRIEPGSALRTAYGWDPLTTFIGRALGVSDLHRYDDALGACSIALFEPGDELGWHFDRSEFAVTVMLQAADEGGDFEYVHQLRTPTDPNLSGVAEQLGGTGNLLRPRLRLANEVGTLSLFRGNRSLHRVTPVVGPKVRINVVLAYSEKPADRLNAITQQLFYGRTA